jgi:hypothetical protein
MKVQVIYTVNTSRLREGGTNQEVFPLVIVNVDFQAQNRTLDHPATNKNH